MGGENQQNTNAEDDGNTTFLLPVHLQTPNDSLGQQEHSDIRNDLNTGRREHHIRQRVAFARQVEFPDGLVWAALHIQKNNAQDSPKTLNRYDNHATPPEHVPGSLDWDKHSTPIHQDGCLYQRQGG